MSARRVATAALAMGLILAACSGGSNTTDTIPDTTVASTSSTTTAPQSSTAPPTSSTTTATTEPPVASDGELLAAWNAYWTVWARQRASNPIDRAALEEVASPEVVDGVVLFFEKERESGAPLSVPRVVPSGVVTSIEGDTATIEACTMISRPPTEVPGTLYDVTMRQATDGRWIVDDLAVVSAAGCVPIELADAAIEAYEAYWDDRDALSNPANPEAAWLTERTTGEHLQVMTDLYTDWQGRGLYFKGRPETHPEVVHVQRDWALVILDCSLMPLDWGIYEIETDQRTNDERAIAEGERGLQSAIMRNDMADGSGTWRVSALAGEADASCEFAPTDDALPQS